MQQEKAISQREDRKSRDPHEDKIRQNAFVAEQPVGCRKQNWKPEKCELLRLSLICVSFAFRKISTDRQIQCAVALHPPLAAEAKQIERDNRCKKPKTVGIDKIQDPIRQRPSLD